MGHSVCHADSGDSSARLSRIMDGAPDGILIHDQAGTVIDANPEACRQLGYSRNELLGLSFRDLLADSDEVTLRSVLGRMKGEGAVTIQLTHRRKDGSHYPAEARLCFLPETGDREMLAVVRDVTEREAAARAREAADLKYRRLIEATRAVPWELDLATGRFTFMGRQAVAVFGYPLEYWSDIDSWAAVVEPDDRAWAVAYCSTESAKGSDYAFTYRARTADGRLLWIHDAVAVLPGPDGRPARLVGYMHDVTEEVEREAELRAAEEKFSKAFHNAPLLMTLSALEDGTYLDVNERFVEVSGYSREEAIGKTSVELGWISSLERERVASVLRAEGRIHGLDLLLTAKDGRVVPCCYYGELVTMGGRQQLLSIAEDITERLVMEVALRDKVSELAATLSALPDLLFEIDDLAVVHSYHAADPSQLHVAPEQFLGRSLFDLMPPDVCRTIRLALAEAESQGRSVGGTYSLGAGEDRRWYEISIASRKSEAAGRSRFIALVRDISQRKALEEQLRHAQKMEAVGALAGGIAHDFNNLLQVISGHVEMLLRGGPNGGQRPALLSIDKAASRASSLVQGLLTFSRRTVPELRGIDVGKEVRLTAEVLGRTLPKAIAVEVDVTDGLWPIFGDANQIEQILMNLAANARDAMPHGGTLTFVASNLAVRPGRPFAHTEVPPGRYVRLSVGDTGSGIPPEAEAQMFQPFFTTKGVGQGTGLGLAVVYGIVQDHRGYIDWETRVGKGTTFHVYLPAAGRLGVEAPGEETPVASTARNLGRVLVVDDEKAVLELAQEALEEAGYSVALAASGEECLARYKVAGPFDAVVLDLGMPGMGGEACLRELLARHPEARVLVASGYGAEQGRCTGARMFLPKPFQLDELTARLRELLN